MDWKREAETKLREYTARKASLKHTEEELIRLKLEATRIRSASTDGMPLRGGGNGREDTVVNNLAAQQEIELARRDTVRWLNTMDSALSVLDDTDRLILDRLCIHRQRGAVSRLCEELGLADESSVYRRKAGALRRFTLALYGATER